MCMLCRSPRFGHVGPDVLCTHFPFCSTVVNNDNTNKRVAPFQTTHWKQKGWHEVRPSQRCLASSSCCPHRCSQPCPPSLPSPSLRPRIRTHHTVPLVESITSCFFSLCASTDPPPVALVVAAVDNPVAKKKKQLPLLLLSAPPPYIPSPALAPHRHSVV